MSEQPALPFDDPKLVEPMLPFEVDESDTRPDDQLTAEEREENATFDRQPESLATLKRLKFATNSRETDMRTKKSRRKSLFLLEAQIVLEMHVKGKTYSEISAATGLSIKVVWARMQLAQSQIIPPETIEAYRTIEKERLDFMYGKLIAKIELADIPAIGAGIKISERKSKLLGLDAPVQIEAKVAVATPESLEVMELIFAARKRNREIETQLKSDARIIEPGLNDGYDEANPNETYSTEATIVSSVIEDTDTES